MVVFLYKYFTKKNFTPKIFDIEYHNEKTGETCALIACRKGNYPLIKALHTMCNADFFVKNSFNENAVVLCVCAYRVEKNNSYIDCIRYLVEKIGIDISYIYEEILMLAECEELIYYVEQHLQKHNIFVTKLEVEEKYKVKQRI